MKKGILIAVLIVASLAWLGSIKDDDSPGESYRLVWTTGNNESIRQTGLTLFDCQNQRDELKTVQQALGPGGAITCLPESSYH
jgi:hypothetical protein